MGRMGVGKWKRLVILSLASLVTPCRCAMEWEGEGEVRDKNG
jgi:hypothetical protein